MIDSIERAIDPEPIKVPANFSRLVVVPGPDKAHVQLRVNVDVTHLREDGQKLLLHYTMQALTKFEEEIKHMHQIEQASKLAKLERVKAVKDNGA